MATRRLTAGSNILAKCDKYSKYEKPVQSGLALTPRDIKQMTERGLAVSTPNLQVFNDSEAFTDSWFIEPQFRRGCDMNTAWETTQVVQSNLINVHKSDKKRYG